MHKTILQIIKGKPHRVSLFVLPVSLECLCPPFHINNTDFPKTGGARKGETGYDEIVVEEVAGCPAVLYPRGDRFRMRAGAVCTGSA